MNALASIMVLIKFSMVCGFFSTKASAHMKGLEGRGILLKSSNGFTPRVCSRADCNLSNAAPSMMPDRQ